MPQPANPVFTPQYVRLRDAFISARRAAGLSQLQLAERVGRDSTHVTLLERGQRRFELFEFYKLAQAMDLDPAMLAAKVFEAWDELADGRGSSQSDSITLADCPPPREL